MQEDTSSQTIGRYRILGTIGRSVTGMICRARDPESGQQVAIKIVDRMISHDPAEHHRALEHFRVHLALITKLRHPSLVSLHDIGVVSDNLYLVTDFVEGENMADVIVRRQKFRPELAIHYLAQVAAALDYAHSRDLAHLNVRSSVIIIDGSNNAVLDDMGLRPIYDYGIDSGEDEMQQIAHMPPEFVLKHGMDLRSDIYSLGVLAFEMFTGHKPFAGQNVKELATNIVNGRRFPLSEFGVLPLSLEAEFERIFSRRKEDRFASAQVAIAAMCAALKIDHPILQAREESQGGSKGAGQATGRKRKFSDWKLFNMAKGATPPTRSMHSGPLIREVNSDEPISAWSGDGSPPKVARHEVISAPVVGPATPGGMFKPLSRTSSNVTQEDDKENNILAVQILALGVGLLAIFSGARALYLIARGDEPPQVIQQAAPQRASVPAPHAVAAKPIPTIALAQVPEGLNLTNFELRSIVMKGTAGDSEILQALIEMKSRKMPDLIYLSGFALKNQSAPLRLAAIKFLGDLKDPKAIGVLTQSLEDSEPGVRMQAVSTLSGFQNEKEALVALAAHLEREKDPKVRSAIQDILNSIK